MLNSIMVAGWMTFVGTGVAAPNNPFRVESTNTVVSAGHSGRVDVILRVPNQHHLYRDMMAVLVDKVSHTASVESADWIVLAPDAACQITVGSPSFPPGFMKPDPADPTSTREQYDMDVIVQIPLTAPACASGTYKVGFVVEYQGCKKSLCWMPQADKIESLVRIEANQAASKTPEKGGQ